jgi:hypothetical protein
LVFEKILKIMEKARNCLPFDSILDRDGAAIIEDVCLLANSMVSDQVAPPMDEEVRNKEYEFYNTDYLKRREDIDELIWKLDFMNVSALSV